MGQQKYNKRRKGGRSEREAAWSAQYHQHDDCLKTAGEGVPKPPPFILHSFFQCAKCPTLESKICQKARLLDAYYLIQCISNCWSNLFPLWILCAHMRRGADKYPLLLTWLLGQKLYWVRCTVPQINSVSQTHDVLTQDEALRTDYEWCKQSIVQGIWNCNTQGSPHFSCKCKHWEPAWFNKVTRQQPIKAEKIC